MTDLYHDGAPVLFAVHLSPAECDEIHNRLQHANDLNMAGDYNEAETLTAAAFETLTSHEGSAPPPDHPASAKTILSVLGYAHHVRGTTLRYKRNFDDALASFKRGLVASGLGNDDAGMARAYGNMGLVYSDMFNVADEVEMYGKAIEIDTRTGNKKGLAMWLNNLALIQGKVGNYSKATELLTQALEYDTATENMRGKASRLQNLAVVHMHLGNNDTALQYLHEALAIDEETGNVRGAATVLNNIAFVHSNLGDNTAAI